MSDGVPPLDLYAHLNPPQRQAVEHPKGPLLILAGAGSGKTRVITHRLAELVRRGVSPGRILAVTFTNKAAGELRERAAQLLQKDVAPLWIGTFHSIGARLLRRHGGPIGIRRNFAILDDAEQQDALAQALLGVALPPHYAEPRALSGAIDQAKNQGLSPDALVKDDPVFAGLYARYQQRLRALSALDFGDLLLAPILLCQKHPAARTTFARLFDHVLVDEFQDVNQAQYRLLKLFCANSRQILAVGDDDQAIYGWRGADVRLILGFTFDWPDAAVVRLEQNYRSTQLILDAANALIRRNQKRHDKTLFSTRKGGAAIAVYQAADERREAEFVVAKVRRHIQDEGRQPGDFAVCYRVNALARVLEDALRGAALPYTLIGGTRFHDRAEIKDLVGYLRVVHNPEDESALRRIINVPSRGIGEATVEKIAAHARTRDVPLWQALRELIERESTLGAAARGRLKEFCVLIADLQGMQGDVATLAAAVLEKTAYLRSLGEGAEAEARRKNIDGLLASLREQEQSARKAGGTVSLQDYLQQAALLSGADQGGRGVSLLTVHAAKGLEFPVVFVTGLEEGLFPLLRRNDDDEELDPTVASAAQAPQIEEERRLMYVAITRAKDRLYLCHARERRLYSDHPRECVPSRFLDELPAACIERMGDAQGPAWAAKKASRTDAPAPGGFQVGQKVRHPSFGEGEVRGVIAAASADPIKLTVPVGMARGCTAAWCRTWSLSQAAMPGLWA